MIQIKLYRLTNCEKKGHWIPEEQPIFAVDPLSNSLGYLLMTVNKCVL
jgi:hypothetical protein